MNQELISEKLDQLIEKVNEVRDDVKTMKDDISEIKSNQKVFNSDIGWIKVILGLGFSLNISLLFFLLRRG